MNKQTTPTSAEIRDYPVPIASSWPTHGRDEILAVTQVLQSGRVNALVHGEQNRAFEKEFAAYIGMPHAIAVSNGTVSIEMALRAFGIGAGDEVIIPARSFFATASAVVSVGASPVFADILVESQNIDPASVARMISEKTKAVICVHLAGLPCDMRALTQLCEDHSLFLIEDCAHAHGASVDGRPAGSIGDVGCFSFYATKVLTCGTGGMLVTNDAAIARSARELRMFGRENGTGPVIREGNDWFLDEIRSCLGYEQVCELPQFLKRRSEIAKRYENILRSSSLLRHLVIPKDNFPAWYHYVVFVAESVDLPRLMDNLKSKHGIPTKLIYPPIQEELIFQSLDDGTLQRASEMLHRSLCLPMHVELSDADVDAVAAAVILELREIS